MKNLYILTHVRVDIKSMVSDTKQIGIYTDIEKAIIAEQFLRQKPGFSNLKANFKIDEIKIDEIYWKDGFDINKWIYFN